MSNRTSNPSTLKDALQHYGYDAERKSGVFYGFWDREIALQNLIMIPESMKKIGLDKKYRIVFDYDPDYPKALLQLQESEG